MPRLPLIAALALTAGLSAFAPQSALAQNGMRQPLYGKTDSLGDPGRIGPNGALIKKVVAGDFFNFRELAEMDLEPQDVITLTMFTTLPRRAPRDYLQSPFPVR
ncbi:hypothetical protein [Falsigemmobacter faecalis]|uniref:Uncharacterized protein n=1 Tax=Falsigemmobacter faecalis TaxID=2488730 RepID=A0A3P3D4U6_9RHOB|nr:hypothetical protein [Falsigemmobacter faecalis]RRH69417.1 hypothetical protein EG244_18335 [Falsigemmobacter faecalis]